MKKKLNTIITVIILTITVFFTGCSGNHDTKDKPALGIVVGAHKYNPTFTVSSELNEKLLYVAENYGNVSVTISSGTPKTVANWPLDVENKDVGAAKLNQIAKANTEVIIQEISLLKADTPEVNTLSAINKEANNVNATNALSKTIIVYDTGLSTSGILNFTTENLLNSSPSFIVDQLESSNALPNLSGIDVYWYGLGQTRGEQELDDENRYKLKAIWTEIINRCNPKSLNFNDAELTMESDDNLPDVTIVDTISTEIRMNSITEESNVVVLEEEQLCFIPDTAEFSDPDAANEKIRSLAVSIKESDDVMYVIGSTATYGTPDSSNTLSEQRAIAVSQALIDNGVNENKLVSVGIGQKQCSLKVNDLDSEGNLVEEQAKHNRAVFLVPKRNKIFTKLMSEGVL